MSEEQKLAPMGELAADLELLGNEQRLALLHALTTPKYAEEIAEVMDISRQAAAKHIDKLQERGFIRALHGRRARGPVIEYQVVPQKFFTLSLGLNDLARLEPTGGPLLHRSEPTVRAAAGEALVASGPARPPTAQLLVIQSPTEGQRHTLEPAERTWTIGRDDDRSIRILHDPYVSARHAEIRRDGEAFDIIDQFSSNGTFVNLARIPQGGRVRIAPGDLLTIGRTLTIFQAPSP